MAKADYIRCDKCDDKIVYDGDDAIFAALDKLGLANLPTYCETCARQTAIRYAYRRGGEEWVRVNHSQIATSD